MGSGPEIQGRCHPRFSAVKDAFARNFEAETEVGASFAATLDGEFVVDLWGGYADGAQTRPWEEETIVNVYSTTKAMTALCTMMLVDRGRIDLDAPVARYWPEFARGGKESVRVRHLLSHTSGLPGFTETMPAEGLYDWDRAVGALAAQEPWWEPGTRAGYHALTFGYLLGELVRRVTGKTLGTFFRDEVALPLKADFHIGLAEAEESRVGELIPPVLAEEELSRVAPRGSMMERVMSNPRLTAKESQTRAWRAAEIPAANGHGNARSVARIASALACGGELEGVRLLSMPTIEKIIEEQYYGPDLILTVPIRWGLGFGLRSKEMPLGVSPRTFFWGGWGGSVIAIDPDARVSFSYVMNRMSAGTLGDGRVVGPALALYDAL
jgi:CubicO group peptidase (beta-lactamase class C family)